MPHVPALGPLHGLAAITEFEPTITATRDAVEVVAAGERLTLASAAENALRTMLSGHPVELTESDDDTNILAEHLIKEGLCEPLTAESSLGYTDLVPTVSCSNLHSLSA
jgi:hypothetical protein